ncbi:MAG: DUF4339 domain-containing protein [Pirellulales bacterium]|nr:DUF4339 domain-containing protein [Pirellulales bacterium]
MAVECRCPGCGQRFKAADAALGHRVKCPQCAAVIQLPGQAPPAAPPKSAPSFPPDAAAPAWFVRTADQRQHGPMGKEQLDRLVAEGQLDGFCEVRRADWDEWRLIEESYPALAIDNGDDDEDMDIYGIAPPLPPVASAEQTPRVRPCPDCGQTVSRRAVQCPHCGCPLTEGGPTQPSSLTSRAGVREQPRDNQGRFARLPGHVGTRHSLIRQVAFLTIAIVLLISVVVGGIYVGIQLLRRSPAPVGPSVKDVLSQTRPSAPVPVQPASPVAQGLTAEAIAQCKNEVAEAKARYVDDYQRTKQQTVSQLAQLTREMDVLRELTDPHSKRPAAQETSKPSPEAAQSYQSQLETLRRECRSYLDAHVTEPATRKETIWSLGEDWVRTRVPEQTLLEGLLQPSAKPPDTP